MPEDRTAADVRAIEAIIDRQFASLGWSQGGTGDWSAFAADFFPGASLYPSARPARQQTVAAFIERMQGLAQTSLRAFRERVLGTEIRVFGNVAMALAACEITENDAKVSHGVEAMLLIRENGIWRIVAQGWDMAGDGKPLPDHLLAQA